MSKGTRYQDYCTLCRAAKIAVGTKVFRGANSLSRYFSHKTFLLRAAYYSAESLPIESFSSSSPSSTSEPRDKHVLSGNRTRTACFTGEHSRQELFDTIRNSHKQIISNGEKNYEMKKRKPNKASNFFHLRIRTFFQINYKNYLICSTEALPRLYEIISSFLSPNTLYDTKPVIPIVPR
jgi:hypothetical protein